MTDSAVLIRPATTDDAEAIAALFTDEGYPAGPSDIVERLTRFASEHSRVLVAEHEGTVLGFIAICTLRLLVYSLFGVEAFKRRILILGAGNNADLINRRLRRRSDRKSFNIIGFLPIPGQARVVADELIVEPQGELIETARAMHAHEIVVAPDERELRSRAAQGQGDLPPDPPARARYERGLTSEIEHRLSSLGNRFVPAPGLGRCGPRCSS